MEVNDSFKRLCDAYEAEIRRLRRQVKIFGFAFIMMCISIAAFALSNLVGTK